MACYDRRRVQLMDELRGGLIILVVVYHFLYDLVVLFGLELPLLLNPFTPWMHFLRDFFTGCIMLISGIACLYSHNNLMRGLKTLGCGLLLTLFTYLFLPSSIILFGILHFFGSAMILYSALAKLLAKIPSVAGMVCSLLGLLATWNLKHGQWGLWPLFLGALPPWLCDKPWLFPLGFPAPGVYSADYYPLLPWFFAFLMGTFIGRPIRQGRAPAWFYQSHAPLFASIGRHTLLIYLLHQPILYAVLSLLLLAIP